MQDSAQPVDRRQGLQLLRVSRLSITTSLSCLTLLESTLGLKECLFHPTYLQLNRLPRTGTDPVASMILAAPLNESLRSCLCRSWGEKSMSLTTSSTAHGRHGIRKISRTATIPSCRHGTGSKPTSNSPSWAHDTDQAQQTHSTTREASAMSICWMSSENR